MLRTEPVGVPRSVDQVTGIPAQAQRLSRDPRGQHPLPLRHGGSLRTLDQCQLQDGDMVFCNSSKDIAAGQQWFGAAAAPAAGTAAASAHQQAKRTR